jgi:hypothetical protein
MLAVIDESGDVGMKLASGSSRFFTLALVLLALPFLTASH